MAYTELQKTLAVELVRRNDGVVNDSIMADIRNALSAPKLSSRVVRYWVKEVGEKSFTEKKQDIDNRPLVLDHTEKTIAKVAAEALDQMFEDTARLYLQQSQNPEVIAATKGKDAVIAAATAVDKMRLLRNLPTEIVTVLPNLLDAIDNAGLSAADVFKTMIEELGKARQEANRADSD